jgi:hypothetical protein
MTTVPSTPANMISFDDMCAEILLKLYGLDVPMQMRTIHKSAAGSVRQGVAGLPGGTASSARDLLWMNGLPVRSAIKRSARMGALTLFFEDGTSPAHWYWATPDADKALSAGRFVDDGPRSGRPLFAKIEDFRAWLAADLAGEIKTIRLAMTAEGTEPDVERVVAKQWVPAEAAALMDSGAVDPWKRGSGAEITRLLSQRKEAANMRPASIMRYVGDARNDWRKRNPRSKAARVR